MESSSRQPAANRTAQIYNEILAGLDVFYTDKTKADVWVKIFWVLGIYIEKDGPLTIQAQKLVNFCLQNKSQTPYLDTLVSQHKELVCKVYDLAAPAADNLDGNLSSGVLLQTISKQLEKQAISDPAILQLLNFCVSATAIHFCGVLQNFKEIKGEKILLSNRRIPKIIKRKSLIFTSSNQFLRQVYSEPVVLLDGFLDSLKPVIGNYLNIENLFEVTSPHFKNKKGLLSGFISSSISSKPEFTGKIVNLNTIFDSTYAGRQMIESKLSQISLSQSENSQDSKNTKWSLLCCIHDLEPQLLTITEKLPLFLRPKSNGDILSYCQDQISPAFRYQAMKPGYVEKPMLSEYTQVFLNAGKGNFEILAFRNSTDLPASLLENEHQNIANTIENYNVQYSKVKVGPRGIAVVPSNCFYVILTYQHSADALIEIVHWNVLPKFNEAIKQTIMAIGAKKKLVKDYILLPVEYSLLSYLNHEYLLVNQTEILETIRNYLIEQLNKQQSQLCSILTKNCHIPINTHVPNPTLPDQNLFCSSCKHNFFNYFGKTLKRQYICMSCCFKLSGDDRLEQIQILHDSMDLRYPLTLVGIYLSKRKYPGESIGNRFEKTICKGKFIGSIQNQNCKTEYQEITPKVNPNSHQQKLQQFYLTNRLKQLKITSLEETIVSIALYQPRTDQEKQELIEKVKCYLKQIEDPESIMKQICGKYQPNNMVTEILWAYRVSSTGRIF